MGVASCLLGGSTDMGEAPSSDSSSSMADGKAGPRIMRVGELALVAAVVVSQPQGHESMMG